LLTESFCTQGFSTSVGTVKHSRYSHTISRYSNTTRQNFVFTFVLRFWLSLPPPPKCSRQHNAVRSTETFTDKNRKIDRLLQLKLSGPPAKEDSQIVAGLLVNHIFLLSSVQDLVVKMCLRLHPLYRVPGRYSMSFSHARSLSRSRSFSGYVHRQHNSLESIRIDYTQITLHEEAGQALRSTSNQSSEPCELAQYSNKSRQQHSLEAFKANFALVLLSQT